MKSILSIFLIYDMKSGNTQVYMIGHFRMAPTVLSFLLYCKKNLYIFLDSPPEYGLTLHDEEAVAG